MKTVLSRKSMRISDKNAQCLTGSIELISRAAQALSLYNSGTRTAIVCGKGNNGADGYALALILKEKGLSPTIFYTEQPATEECCFFSKKCTAAGIVIKKYSSEIMLDCYDTIYDCIFGIGFSGIPARATAELFEKINNSGAYIVSADINSGLDADSGLAQSCVISDITVSFGAYKSGHFLNDAKDKIKRLENHPIGIAPCENIIMLTESEDFSSVLPARKHNSHKGTYGTIALLGGSKEYSGAIKLAAMACAAMRSGCGICKIITDQAVAQSVLPLILESTLCPIPEEYGIENIREALHGVKAVAAGMGWGQGDSRKAVLKHILSEANIPVVLDADALNILSQDMSPLRDAACPVILTPHPAELSRLSGKSVSEILGAPIECAMEFAREYDCILLLKGSSSVITDGKRAFLCTAGCPGMATAGSGDVLSGIIAGLLGYNPPSLLTVACAAYIAGTAGMLAEKRVGSISMLASDTVSCISDAVLSIQKQFCD